MLECSFPGATYPGAVVKRTMTRTSAVSHMHIVPSNDPEANRFVPASVVSDSTRSGWGGNARTSWSPTMSCGRTIPSAETLNSYPPWTARARTGRLKQIVEVV
jgi:hypothetical protein